MKRGLTIRLLVGTLLVVVSLVLFSYVHALASRQEEPNSDSGKCDGDKSQSEFVLWESLTHNLLIGKR